MASAYTCTGSVQFVRRLNIAADQTIVTDRAYDHRSVDALNALPTWALVAGPVVLGWAFLALPAHRRLPVSLALTVVWFGYGRLPELPAAAAAKFTSFIPLALVLLAAVTSRRLGRTPPAAVVYVLTGAFGVLAAASTASPFIPTAEKVQWVLLCLAATVVVRAATDQAERLRLLTAFAWGSVILIAILASATIADPRVMRLGPTDYQFRFSPYGVHPNQIGSSIIAAVAACATVGLLTVGRTRLVMFSTAAAGAVMLAATYSRGNLAALAILSLPIGWSMLRRSPVAALLVVAVLAGGAYQLVGQAEDVSLARISTLSTARTDVAGEYIEQAWDRPVAGLLFTSGYRADRIDPDSPYAHNGYLAWLYLAGAIAVIPLLLLAGVTTIRALRAMRDRRSSLATSQLGVFIIGVYALGFVHDAMYQSADPYALLHVIMSLTFLEGVPFRSSLDERLPAVAVGPNGQRVSRVGLPRRQRHRLRRRQRPGRRPVGVGRDRP